MAQKTAREINVNKELLENKNLKVKIGATENRNSPDTIYIDISFWVQFKHSASKEDNAYYRDKLKVEIDSVHRELSKKMLGNYYFPDFKNSIRIINIPENFNNFNKPNFVSVEMHLNTVNIKSNEKIPLNSKKNSDLFLEAVKVSNYFGSFLKFNKNGLYSFFEKKKC